LKHLDYLKSWACIPAPSGFEIIRIKSIQERVLSKKKVSWGSVLGVLLLIAACVAAYNITKLPEKNVRLPVMQSPTA